MPELICNFAPPARRLEKCCEAPDARRSLYYRHGLTVNARSIWSGRSKGTYRLGSAIPAAATQAAPRSATPPPARDHCCRRRTWNRFLCRHRRPFHFRDQTAGVAIGQSVSNWGTLTIGGLHKRSPMPPIGWLSSRRATPDALAMEIATAILLGTKRARKFPSRLDKLILRIR
ncbi:MAG: hypothetical protein IPO00_16515 [Betaproteobacteria bacterium]|nr:hypothetical protein [Betaproteobacteria bacterium]